MDMVCPNKVLINSDFRAMFFCIKIALYIRYTYTTLKSY